MSMTRAQCYAQVKRYIGEIQTEGEEALVTDTDLGNWLSDAHYMVRDLLPISLAQGEEMMGTLLIFSSMDIYLTRASLPTDWYRTSGVQVVNGSQLVDATSVTWKRLQTEHHNLWNSTIDNSGTTYYYCEKANSIYFVPNPAGNVYIYYLPKPTIPASNSANLDVPDGAENLVCLYIGIQAAIRMRNRQLRDDLLLMFNTNIVNRGGRALVMREEKVAPGSAELGMLGGGG